MQHIRRSGNTDDPDKLLELIKKALAKRDDVGFVLFVHDYTKDSSVVFHNIPNQAELHTFVDTLLDNRERQFPGGVNPDAQ